MSYSTGVILVATAAVLWSLMGLAIREIQEAGTWAILFWRSAAMVPALLAFFAWRRRKPILPALRATGRAGLMAGFGLVVAFAGAIFAIQSTTVANAVFLFAASPFLAAALSWAARHEVYHFGVLVIAFQHGANAFQRQAHLDIKVLCISRRHVARVRVVHGCVGVDKRFKHVNRGGLLQLV